MTYENPRVSSGAIAYLEQLVAYRNDASKAPHDNPPVPTPDISNELAAIVAQIMAMAVDFERTGQMHEDPSVAARLAAVDLIRRKMGW